MTNMQGAEGPTPSDVTGARIRMIRRRNRQSVDELAKACAEVGHPELTKDAIYTIESGRRDKSGRRRRTVSVDELLAFAKAFEVPAWDLLPAVAPSAAELQEIDEILDRLRPVLGQLAGELEKAGAPAKQGRKGRRS